MGQYDSFGKIGSSPDIYKFNQSFFVYLILETKLIHFYSINNFVWTKKTSIDTAAKDTTYVRPAASTFALL